VLLTRPPLRPTPKDRPPCDLHVLGTPPAFVLSQDQTRHPSIVSLFPSAHPRHFRMRRADRSSTLTCICVVCTTQSNDMMLRSHPEASARRTMTRATASRGNLDVLLLLTLQLSRFLIGNDSQPLLIRASPRLSRDTPLDYHRTHGAVKGIFARLPRSSCS
jgi:hypothetical protein